MDEIEELINSTQPESTAVDPNSPDPISQLIKRTTPTEYSESNIVGYNSEFGESRFDKGFQSDLMTDLEDYRSKKQPALEKAGKGLLRVGNKIGVELAKIPGYIGGAVAAPFAEDGEGMNTFVNNNWIKAIEGYEEIVNSDIIPIYTKKAVREGNLWDNISSIDFWAKEGSDGLAFMLSMMAPGMAISKAGVGAKMLGGLGKSKVGMNMLSKMDEAAKVMGIESAGGAIDLAASTTVNTLFEAGSEAGNAMNSLVQKEGESDEEFNLRKGRIGRDIFLSNVAILTVPNLLLNKSVMNLGKQSSRLNKFKNVNGEIATEVQKKGIKKLAWDWSSKVLAPNVIREGFFEEGMQSTVEEYWKNNEEFNAGEMLSTYIDTVASTDGQKAIMLGGLFGTTASSFGAYNKAKNDKKRDNSIVNAMNSSINFWEKSQTGFYKKDDKGNIILDEDQNPIEDLGKLKDEAEAVANIQEIQQRLEIAKITGDKEGYALLKDRLDSILISPFMKAGEDGINILKEKLQESSAIDESINDLNELGVNTTKKDQIGKVIEKAESARKEYEFFKNYGEVLSGFKVPKEEKDIYNAFINNLENAYVQTRMQIKTVDNLITEAENLRNEMMNEYGIEDKQQNENITNPLIGNLINDVNKLKSYKEELNGQVNDILNKKKQKEAYNIIKEEQAEIEEVEEKVAKEKKEGLTAEQEAATKTSKAKVKQEHTTKAATKSNVKQAKNENNKFYETLDDIINNYEAYDLEEIPNENGAITNMVDETHIAPILKFVPIRNTDEIKLYKEKNKDGQDRIVLEIISEEGTRVIHVDKYNVKEDETDESDNIPSETPNSINGNDNEYTPSDNVNVNKESVTDDIKSETNSEDSGLIRKKHVKTVISKDPLMTSIGFEQYRITPKNKKGEKVTFELGYPGTNVKASEAIDLYNNLLEGGFDVTEDQRQFLIKHLPIKVNFGKNTKSDNSSQKADIERKNKLLANRKKDSIEKLKSINNLLAYHYLLQKIGIQNPYGSDASLLTSELGVSFKEAEQLIKERQNKIKPKGWKLGDSYDTSILDKQVENALKQINIKYDAEIDALEGTTTSQQKADIERRRQEESNNKAQEIVNRGEVKKEFRPITKEDKNNKVDFNSLFSNISKVLTGEIKSEIEDANKILKQYLKEIHPDKFQEESQKLIAEIFTTAMIIVGKKGDIIKLNELYEKYKQINAKYDAELAALSNNNSNQSQITDIERRRKEELEEYDNSIAWENDATDKEKYKINAKYDAELAALGNNSSEVFTHLFNEDGSGKYKLDTKEIELRTAIVNKVLDIKSMNNISTTIAFQFPGDIQNEELVDNKPPTNSIMEIEGINSLSDIKLAYNDTKGRVLNVDGTESTDFNTLKHPGSIFMVVKMANGKKFPLKLNIRRLNEQEVDTVLKLTEKLLATNNISWKTNISKFESALNLEKSDIDFLKQEAIAINKKYTSINISDIFRDIIFEGNTEKNKFQIKNSALTYGNQTVTSSEFSARRDDIKDWLLNNKNRNIMVSKLTEQPYKKHIVDNVVSTDVKLEQPIFQGNTNIYISPSISAPSTKATKKQAAKKVEALKSNKETTPTKNKKKSSRSRGSKLRDIKKGVNQMKKDSDQNSNTIC